MNELLKIQDQFQSYLLHANDEIATSIVSTENVSIDLRLMIYQNAYRGRLLEVIESDYPVLKPWMKVDFDQLGQDYIDTTLPINSLV